MLFGHSMGALISYELVFKLFEKYKILPNKLYISAHKAPFLERGGPVMHKLEKSEFVNELKDMNGIAKELFEHNELMELMLPIIRNDYAVCENYNYQVRKKLNIPITAFGGIYDKDVKEEDLKQWAIVTNLEFNHILLEGDHFFITKEKEQFLNVFSKILLNDTAKISTDK
jgi:medium-chain acyl-[acyl-carrier-protein] hydrolase